MLALYSLATWAAQPLLRRKLARRGLAEPGYLHAVPERFGHYGDVGGAASSAGAGPLVWLHAVSLGETRAAAVLLPALRACLPGMRLLLTHGTATGRAEGAGLLQAGDVQVWQPWDTRAATRRFMQHFRPDIGLLMETEVWPNLVAAARAQGVPLALVNARLSQRSMRGAQRLPGLMRPAYAGLSAVWAQTPEDAERLRRMGAPVAQVTGNLKFDALPDAALLARGQAWRGAGDRPVLMLASSREGEEALWLDALEAWSASAVRPSRSAGALPRWLVVPRHPQRFDEVAALVRARGLRLSRRSEWGQAPDAPPAAAQQADVWLGDSLGEMPLYYALADAALLGGSFAPLGGQNLIEAAACGCPVFMGPHTFNFARAAADAQAAGAARGVADMAAAVAAASDVLAQPGAHQAMRQAALDFAHAHRGAAQRTAQAVAQLVLEKR